MTTVRRVPVTWSGVTGLPGVSAFTTEDDAAGIPAIKAYFNAIKALFPAGVSWQIPTSGDTFDDTTGTINGSWSDSGGGTVASTGSGIWAAGTGTYVRWQTTVIRGGRRVKGRTFLCPIFGSAYQSDGTILDAYVTTLQTAADALVAADSLCVWARPGSSGVAAGAACKVSSATQLDRVTSLRSRRV